MESVESRAKEALEAYLKCNETVKSVYYKKICDHDCDNCNLNYAQGTYGDHKEAVKTAIQALEKQIPMKPVHDGCLDSEGMWHEWNGVNGRPYDLCPNCNTNLCCEMPNDNKPNYCSKCGCRLDWSDGDE